MVETRDYPAFNGRRVVYRPELKPAEGTPAEPDYNHGGKTVVEPGNEGTIVAGSENVNGVEGLRIYRVEFDRGTHTHLSLREVRLLGERYDVLDHNDDVLESSDVWAFAAARAKEHGFRVRDNHPDDGDEPRIEYDARQ